MKVETKHIKKSLKSDEVPVISGFQGINKLNRITTLGRGGSDTTAVALAASLGAKRCDIYTDVAGVYSADPRIVKEAKKIGEKLIVALNSDNWLIEKKGKYFLPFKERKVILESLVFVDEVIGFEDDEFGSCKNALRFLKKEYLSLIHI